MLPFVMEEDYQFNVDDYIFVPGIAKAVRDKDDIIKAYVVGDNMKEINLTLGALTDAERDIILAGCLINYYRQ
jgi:aconitate hydratase